MKRRRTRSYGKVIALLLSAAALVAVSVFGTLAYLTDKDTVVNTFTVGSVNIKLDEADVNEMGVPEDNTNTRWEPSEDEPSQTYHLIPGHAYKKDPTVTVLKGSEKSYVRMMVTVSFSKELDVIFDTLKPTAPNTSMLQEVFTGYDPNEWTLFGVTEDAKYNTRTYEFRYKDVVAKASTGDIKLKALFEGIKVPGPVTNEQLATLVKYKTDASGNTVTDTNGNPVIESQMTITVNAHAIQADGFKDAGDAWAAFDNQTAPAVTENSGEVTNP